MDAAYCKSRQVLEETGQERETRTTGGFHSIEGSLPIIGSRLNIPLLDGISSYLGQHNPLASSVQPGVESAWLFENTAYRPVRFFPFKPGPWQVEIVTAFFKKNTGKDVSKIVAQIAEKIGLGNDGEDEEQEKKTIAERLQPFIDTISPARSINVMLPTGRVRTLGPGGPSAVSTQTVSNLGEHNDGDVVSISAVLPEVTPYGPMTTHFAGPEGWAVISDIDDTIKVTMTPSPIGILRSTFVSPPTPIASMPSLYQQIAATLDPTWFYLSASPYNLHPFLSAFIREHYPAGPIFLRDASWMDLGGFLASLTQGTQAYKRSRMEKIHAWLPRRKVLCIGDSTQSDPEAYGDMCRKHPGWVRAVFIRKVVDVAEMAGTGKNDDERFAKAFRGVDRAVWRTFSDPQELWEAVENLQGN
ncbi:hypothetical protein MMC07_004466 [Pseudocyphellaria aurata]|nr:hypothetical protein [Pseudocyphellaria aurata]